ncbi:hypothetical protein D9M71_603100 [compost metagenome]
MFAIRAAYCSSLIALASRKAVCFSISVARQSSSAAADSFSLSISLDAPPTEASSPGEFGAWETPSTVPRLTLALSLACCVLCRVSSLASASTLPARSYSSFCLAYSNSIFASLAASRCPVDCRI